MEDQRESFEQFFYKFYSILFFLNFRAAFGGGLLQRREREKTRGDQRQKTLWKLFKITKKMIFQHSEGVGCQASNQWVKNLTLGP